MKTEVKRRGAAVAFVLIAVSVPRPIGQELTPFVVGVAEFNNRAPESLPLERIPVEWWGASTFQRTWEMVDPRGRRAVQILDTGPGDLGSGCSINVSLKTDAAKTSEYRPVLATNIAGVVEPIGGLTSDTNEWKTVQSLLPGIYQQHEAAAWREVREDFRPDMTKPAPIQLAAAFAATDAQGQYLYFESYRAFRPRPGQLGSERSFITGWLWRRSSSSPLRAVSIRAGSTDEDQKGDHAFRPLGIVRHGARRFWLGSLRGYAYSAMAVFDVRRSRIRELLIAEYPGC